ncbi:MAG: choloylglycine hydrolase [Clostridiales bacterium]|nr:choloylglycine hydrolase [Clostridiales bacterium]
MCTAIVYKSESNYFGRTLDWWHSYGEKIIVTPRGYPYNFKMMHTLRNHYAFVGTALESDGYPLYFDAVNEKGLCIASLNFSGSAVYCDYNNDKINIASFELIPWILCNCADVLQAEKMLEKVNIADIPFSSEFPPAPLHWIISDKTKTIVAEPLEGGLKISVNDVGVLTNDPVFDYQMFNLNNYISLSSEAPENTFSTDLRLSAYSCGMGALGLPGDNSSVSRFVRAAFIKSNSICPQTEYESVCQFFHIMENVSQTKGCVKTTGGENEYTVYTSCCNADKGVYYYKTYGNSSINCVDMHRENLNSDEIILYNFINSEKINPQN